MAWSIDERREPGHTGALLKCADRQPLDLGDRDACPLGRIGRLHRRDLPGGSLLDHRPGDEPQPPADRAAWTGETAESTVEQALRDGAVVDLGVRCRPGADEDAIVKRAGQLQERAVAERRHPADVDRAAVCAGELRLAQALIGTLDIADLPPGLGQELLAELLDDPGAEPCSRPAARVAVQLPQPGGARS